jgi:predicted PurR-regulated permease PerM
VLIVRSLHAERWVGRGLLLVALLFLLQQAQPFLLPVVAALVLAFVLAPAVRALQRAGVPRHLGAALLIVAILAVVAALASLLAAPAARMWARAPIVAQRILDSLQRVGLDFPSLPAAGGSNGAPRHGMLVEGLASEGAQITRALLGKAFAFTISATATVFLLYFLLVSERWLVERTLQAVQRRVVRLRLLAALGDAQREIGTFVTTMALTSLLLGVATGLGLRLIGFPDAALWGAATAVLTFVPYVGPALVALALVLAGSEAYGAGWALGGPALLFLGLHFVEANLLSPLLMGSRLRINPVFVFLSVLLWGWLWGVAGTFVALPLLLGLRAAARRVPRLRLLRAYLDPDFRLLSHPRHRGQRNIDC